MDLMQADLYRAMKMLEVAEFYIKEIYRQNKDCLGVPLLPHSYVNILLDNITQARVIVSAIACDG